MSLPGRPNGAAGLTAFVMGEGSERRPDGRTATALLKRRAQAKVTAVVV